MIIGSSKRNIPLIECRVDGAVIAANDGPVGAGGAPFELVFPEAYFADGEVIVGNLNELYRIIVKGNPRPEGTNYVYLVQQFGDNVGIPAERLLAGEKFSWEYAPIEKELSRKVGDLNFSSPIAMRNEFSRFRLQHKVAGSMLDKKLAMGIPMVKRGTDGKMVKDTANYWMHYALWEFELKWSDYKNNILAYGRSNRNSNGEYLDFGKSGNVIRLGDGWYVIF